MNYRDFTLGDWIGHISGVIEDETTLDGNEMRDLVGFLTTMQRPKTEWIPVSERLPKDGQFVLFCDIDDDIMVGYHVKGRSETHFSQDGTYDDMKNVVAWMPLPEPYKLSEIPTGSEKPNK